MEAVKQGRLKKVHIVEYSRVGISFGEELCHSIWGTNTTLTDFL